MKSIGIVGVGYWGPNYARILSAIDTVHFSWCADLNAQALAKMQKSYPDVKVTTSVSDLLADTSLDAVIIVTPAQTHFDLVKQFLKAGKDVLVEKPITTNTKDGAALIALAKKHKRILMVDHTFVFNRSVQALKTAIDDGHLGKLLYAHGQYNALGPIRYDVSAMWDLPHLIYVAQYLFGSQAKRVSAVGKSYYQKDKEDVVFLTMEFPKNILFNLSCSWIDPVKVRKLTLVGDKKMAAFDDMVSEKLTFFDKGVQTQTDPNFAKLQLVVRNGDVTTPYIPPNEPLKDAVLCFLSALESRKLEHSTAVDGVNLVRVLEAAQESLSQSGASIEI